MGAWLTCSWRVIPPPVTVTVAVLVNSLWFAVAFILNEPLPVRFTGVTFVIEIQ